MLNKKLMAVVVLVAVMCAVPSWGAQFKRKIISDAQFVDMCSEGDTQGVIEAIKAGINVNAKNNNGETALMWAAGKGHTEIVNALIKAGANVNAKTKSDWTALMYAAGKGHIETVIVLLKVGADVNAKTNGGLYSGWTALMVATMGGQSEIVNKLIKAGADVNAANDDGMTALMFVAQFGYTEIVNALIEAGADDLTDKEGKTALIHATQYNEFFSDNNPETVNALIDAGSYVKHKDNSGKTALDYARENPSLRDTDALKRLEELSR